MLPLVSILVSDVLPVFAVGGGGYPLARFVGANLKTVTHIVFYAALPCLVFRPLTSAPGTGRQHGGMVSLAVLMALSMASVVYTVATAAGLDRVELRAFMLVVMFSNAGNYGLPAVRFAFGGEALAYGAIFFLTGSVLTYTVGAFIAAGARGGLREAVMRVAGIPAIYGVIAAAIVIVRPVTLLSDAALPLMLLVLGVQLQRATWPAKTGAVGMAVATSLIAAPVIALFLTSALGVPGVAHQAAVTLSAMAVAVATTIVALEFELAPAFVTSTVFVSTMMSPLTITPLIAYLR